MDSYEATKIVYSRIQTLDPENAAKIMGHLLMQDHGEKEMIRLAFGAESHLQSVVINAYKDLCLLLPSSPSSPVVAATATATAGSNAFIYSRKNSLSPSSPLPPANGMANEQLSGGNDLLDELLLNDQFSFLNDHPVEQKFAGGGELFHTVANCASWPRNSPVLDLFHGGEAGGLGWKPCLYFARGYCKNGSNCRFLHGLSDDTAAAIAGNLDAMVEQQFLLRSKSQRLMASAATSFPFSMTNSFPPSPSSASYTNSSFLLHKFLGRPWMERSDFAGMANPGSRQIYLTFPADSTFREEDVSNHFSIYGPVQDVRIPYQQKRMFGFVTFVFAGTVKLILAKGNPHFVCDSRVLVKPYKEKGKVPEKYRKQQLQGDGGEFSSCTTPTGLDSRDPNYLQPLGARMLYGSCKQDVLLSSKMEQQQQELQKAIELQQGRFVGLQLLDIRMPNLPLSTAVASAIGEEKTQSADNGATAAFSSPEKKETSIIADGDFHESGFEHNLPDSPFASPTKSSVPRDFSLAAADSSSASSAFLPSTLFPATPPLESMASFKSCFFQVPRISGSGAVGL